MDGLDVAIEVRKTHAVDQDKLALLQLAFSEAIELDASDLPASGVTLDQLEAVLRERRRWRWLVSSRRTELEANWRWEHHDWMPDVGTFGWPSHRTPRRRLAFVMRSPGLAWRGRNSSASQR